MTGPQTATGEETEAPQALHKAPVRPARGSRTGPPVASCETCFFRVNLLCALDRDEPCATYRPNTPDGLRPPRQLRFDFRNKARQTSAWRFPTADEQAALHDSSHL